MVVEEGAVVVGGAWAKAVAAVAVGRRGKRLQGVRAAVLGARVVPFVQDFLSADHLARVALDPESIQIYVIRIH